jgi:hypothetical protein
MIESSENALIDPSQIANLKGINELVLILNNHVNITL